ncbi:hypothetical protein DPMN_068887 [Dreissena polymorpha]|uniref:Uncharacterized protein n=1 Tax=Dreissena polymorpha TaxID=45954 RepID=A0A9D3Z395_DREPO|nr:hypothetical protein DPMN_068887 [Dreissena polymorpha]
MRFPWSPSWPPRLCETLTCQDYAETGSRCGRPMTCCCRYCYEPPESLLVKSLFPEFQFEYAWLTKLPSKLVFLILPTVRAVLQA